MLTLQQSCALAFVLLAALMFGLIVVRNWPETFFPDVEPSNHVYTDNDGVQFRCTRSEFTKWHLEDSLARARGDGKLVFERSSHDDVRAPTDEEITENFSAVRRSKLLPDRLKF